jgi:hypothetical protein
MSAALGYPLHGEFFSADASALTEPNSRILLYQGGAIKGATALTLGATDYVFISALLISTDTTLHIQVYDGGDNVVDAAEMIADVRLLANTSIALSWTHNPRRGPVGAGGIPYPKIKSSAGGNVSCILIGTVHTAP